MKSGFLGVTKASTLWAINGQKESRRPREADRTQYNSKKPLIIQTPAASLRVPTHVWRKGRRQEVEV